MSPAVHVLVIGGGANEEHEVSLASATAVRRALVESGQLVTGLTIRRDGSWESLNGTPLGIAAAVEQLRACDVVFPVLHGATAEDGTIAGFLETVGVRYIGSGVRAGALAMDKWAVKLVAERLGIAVTPGLLVDGTRWDGDPATLRFPVVVKPVASGSSVGATRVPRQAELAAAIAAAQRVDARVLVEEFVVGREIDVAVMRRPSGEVVVAPPLEIGKDPEGIFDTALKYDAAPDFTVPARLDAAVRERLERCAVAVYEALGCAGVARVDFFVRGQEVVFNEVNTMPGMTEHSQVPRMFAAAGVSFAGLVSQLVSATIATRESTRKEWHAEDLGG